MSFQEETELRRRLSSMFSEEEDDFFDAERRRSSILWPRKFSRDKGPSTVGDESRDPHGVR